MSQTITMEEVDSIAHRIQRIGWSEQMTEVIRMEYPGRRFTFCSDDDISSGRPVVSDDEFCLYLVGGDGHCLFLTNDYDSAIGIVIAQVMDD